jgi:fluoride exporter
VIPEVPLRAILLIAVAGAGGAVSRYGVGLWAQRQLGGHFAFGTLLVNILGCLLLGFILELESQTDWVGTSARLFLAVGFLGAFTTFSTFGFETLKFLQAGDHHLAMLNVFANLLLGFLAVWLGWMLARMVAGGI